MTGRRLYVDRSRKLFAGEEVTVPAQDRRWVTGKISVQRRRFTNRHSAVSHDSAAEHQVTARNRVFERDNVRWRSWSRRRSVSSTRRTYRWESRASVRRTVLLGSHRRGREAHTRRRATPHSVAASHQERSIRQAASPQQSQRVPAHRRRSRTAIVYGNEDFDHSVIPKWELFTGPRTPASR